MANWKRPESVPFPSIWSRFEGKKEINGKIPKFWIQDIPEDMFDEAVEMMCKNLIYDEPLYKYSKLNEDELSVKEIKEAWRERAGQKLGLICFMENSDPNGKPIIAGLNMTFCTSKEDVIPEYKGQKWLMALNTVLYVSKLKDVYSLLGIDKYLNAIGLTVLPEFRGQGIGEEFLNARIPLCKAVGLPATLTFFSSTAAQKLAARVGFKDIVNISYEEIEAQKPEFKYPGISEHTKNCRFMYLMVE